VTAVPVAEVVRNAFVESVHFGHVVALRAFGDVALAAGDISAPMLPRSTNKLVQAAAMLRAGLDLDGELLALAASSHSGESYHLEGVRAILRNAGLDESALQNTPDLPASGPDRRAWIIAGRQPSAIAQGCSGKHAAMLATCVAAGWPTDSYRDPEHPLQQAISAVLEQLSGDRVTATVVDGCGAPAMAITLTGLARSFAALATAAGSSPEGNVAAAVRAYPQWVGGTGRSVTRLMEGVPGLIVKDGAEGVYAAALPDGRAVAVKVSDGSDRACVVVLLAALRALGLPAEAAADLATRPVLGHGRPVGEIRPVGLG
jgi:L-asparaginase II